MSTDNFEKIYNRIAKINQGISLLEISKYKNAFRQIIDTKGKQGELKQVLTSFVDLDRLPEELKSKNLVVALGDDRFIYKYPTYVDYIKGYFLKGKTPIEIAVRFIVNVSTKSTLLVSKYVVKIKNENIILKEKDKDKINTRLGGFKVS